MSSLEDRLRDAYRDEAGAVTPESIVRLGEAITAQSPRAARPVRPRPWIRWLTPLAAAAAVAVIVIVAAVAVPRDSGRPQPTASTGSSPAGAPKFLINDTTGMSPLPVRNATTGALVAQVPLPQEYPGGNSRTYVGAVATGNGRNYLVAVYANPCRSWIYQFTLDSQGHPSALTPFAALPTVKSELYDLTISSNGQMVGFTTTACQGAKAQPNYVGVTNVRTGRTTRWTVPSRNSVDAVSLTADGKQLCYSLQLPASVARVIPTSAAPGRAADIGRTVARAQSGMWISFSVISADGSKVYFSSFTEATLGQSAPMTGQIRVADLATGRSRVVYAPAGQPGLIASSPGARYLLLQTQTQGQSAKLVRLDPATGKATNLPAARFGQLGLLYW
jgi:hypothetical protein